MKYGIKYELDTIKFKKHNSSLDLHIKAGGMNIKSYVYLCTTTREGT